MSLRRRAVPVRLGAGLALATACVLAPTAAFAAPDGPGTGEENPAEECQGVPQISVSASEVQAGETVTVSGSCFEGSSQATIVVTGPENDQSETTTSTTGEVSGVSFTVEAPGEYRVQITVNGVQADTSFTVLPAEDPEDPENPEDPQDPENPEDPEDPEDPETPEEPENPEEPEEPENPAPGDEDEGEDPDEGSGDDDQGSNPDEGNDPDEGSGDGDDQAGSDGGSNDGQQPEEGTSPTPPTNDFPGEVQDDDEGGQPTAAPQQPSPAEAPANPAPATQDFPSADAPAAGSPSAMHLQGSALAQALFGLAGTGTEAEASDGGGEDELAETGIELSYGAVAAAVTLGAGATLLWTQRRREN